MADQAIAEILLRIRTEGNEEAIASTRNLIDSVADLPVTLADADTEAEALTETIVAQTEAVTALADQQSAVGEATAQLIDRNQQLADSYDQVAQSAQGAGGAEQAAIPLDPLSNGGGGADGSGGGLTRGDVRGLRYALNGVPGGSELTGAAGAVAYLGAAGAAFAAFGLVLKAATAEAQQGEQITKESTDVQKAYFTAIETGTTESITAARDAAALQVKIQQDLVNQYTTILKEAGVDINEQFGNVGGTLIKIGESLGLGSGVAKGYIDALAEAQSQLGKNKMLVDAYNSALGNSQVVTNDATAGAQDYAKSLVDQAQSQIQISQMTAAQREQEAASVANQISIFQAAIQAHQGNADAVNALTDAETPLIERYFQLTTATDTYADAQAKLNELTQQQLSIAQTEASAQSQTAEQRAEAVDGLYAEISATQDYIDSHHLTADAITQLTTQMQGWEDQATDLASINHTYADDLAAEAQLKSDLTQQSDENTKAIEAVSQAESKLADAEEKAAETAQDLTDAETEHQNKITQIQSDAQEKREQNQKQFDLREEQQRAQANLSIEAAVGRGDLASADQQIAAQNLKSQQDKQNFDQQQQQLDAQTAKLLAAEDARYSAEFEKKSEANAKAIQQEQELQNALNTARSEAAFTQQYWAGVISDGYAKIAQQSGALRDQTSALGEGIAGLTTAYQAQAQVVGGLSSLMGSALSGISGGSGGINATGQGYDYGNGIYPPGFTGSPLPPISSGGGNNYLTFHIDASGSNLTEGDYRRITREELVPIVNGKQIETIQLITNANNRAKQGQRL